MAFCELSSRDLKSDEQLDRLAIQSFMVQGQVGE